jgi:hypothetical protein
MDSKYRHVGYLERGLWRQLFKLEHVREGKAIARPTRFLIASVLIFDKVGYPSCLGGIARDFASGKFERMKAVNRVPYEVPEKDVIAFCPLEMGSFAAIVNQFQEMSLLFEYDEGTAYNPGTRFGDSAPLVVLEDGRFGVKQYFWEQEVRSYKEYIQLVEQKLEEDPDFIDDCEGRIQESKKEEHAKRLDFIDACLAAAKRDGCVPVITSCATLLPLLIDFFPHHATSLNLLRLFIREMGPVRLTAEELLEARNDPRVRTIRDKLRSSIEMHQEEVDSYNLCDMLVDSLCPYRACGLSQSQKTRCEVALPPGTWPNNQVDKLPDRTQWADTSEAIERNLLVFWSSMDRGRVCIGYTRRFFECY